MIEGVAKGNLFIRDRLNCHNPTTARCVCFAKHLDGGSLISGSLDSSIRIMPTKNPSAARTLIGHVKGVTSIAVLEQAVIMVSAGFDRELLVWSLMGDRPHARLRGHFSPVVQLECDESNTEVISLGSDGTIRVWDMRKMRCLQVLNSHALSSAAGSATVQLRGREVALADAQPEPEDNAGGAEIRFPISSICYDQYNRSLITGNRGLLLWRSSQQGRLAVGSADRPRYHEGAVTCVAYSEEYELLASGDSHSTICVWEVRRNRTPASSDPSLTEFTC